MTSLAIVAEQSTAGESIWHALRYARGCRVIGRLDGREPVTAALVRARPDTVLIDDMSSRTQLLERIREARAALQKAKVILLSHDLSPATLGEATDAGADAAISRTLDAVSFATLIAAVSGGTVYNTFTMAPRTSTAVRDGLTAREVEVLQMVAGGASNVRIAKSLWVTEQTVKYHLTNIYRKLGVANRTEASHHAHVHGYINPGLVAHIPVVGQAAA